jgi:energy-coupling factor transport system permease protein
VALLLLLTACSGLPWRLWRRTLPLLLALSLLVGGLAALLPAELAGVQLTSRPPQELRLAPEQRGARWELLRWGPLQLGPVPLGPLVITRRSAELGLNSATLLFTVIHSANLLLLTTPPETLVWGLSWCLAPLAPLGVPVERLGFTLLLALRFLPLVQEEFQNLLRSLATRSVNLRRLGLQASLALVLALGERLLANVLLRAEQGAEALLARGGGWIAPAQLLRAPERRRPLQALAAAGLLLVLGLRWKYGAL